MNIRKLKKKLGIKELPEPFKKLYDKLKISPNELNGFNWDNHDDVQDIFEVSIDEDEKLSYFSDNLIVFSSMNYTDFLFWMQKDIPTMKLPIVKIESNEGFIKIEALNFTDFIRHIITDNFLYEWENEDDIENFRKEVEKISGLLPFTKEEKILRLDEIKNIQEQFNNWLINNGASGFTLTKENYGSRAE